MRKISVIKFDVMTLILMLVLFSIGMVLKSYSSVDVWILEVIDILFYIIFGLGMGACVIGRYFINYQMD